MLFFSSGGVVAAYKCDWGSNGVGVVVVDV